MSESLAARHCEACGPGTPPLPDEEVSKLVSELQSHWTREGNAIQSSFEFKNFGDAFAFATRIALLAENEGHHPDLKIGWGYLDVSLTTHVAGGLTENDFIMAARIDRMEPGGLKPRT